MRQLSPALITGMYNDRLKDSTLKLEIFPIHKEAIIVNIINTRLIYEKGEMTMKRFKKFLLLMMCVGVLCGVTACGTDNDAKDGVNNTTDERKTNDATDGVKDKDGDGVLDDAVDDVTDGIDDAADNLTDDNGPQKDNLNDRNTNNKQITDDNKADSTNR